MCRSSFRTMLRTLTRCSNTLRKINDHPRSPELLHRWPDTYYGRATSLGSLRYPWMSRSSANTRMISRPCLSTHIARCTGSSSLTGGWCRFAHNQELMGAMESNKVILLYNKVAKALIEYEVLWTASWLRRIHKAHSGLDQPLLLRDPETGCHTLH